LKSSEYTGDHFGEGVGEGVGDGDGVGVGVGHASVLPVVALHVLRRVPRDLDP